MLAKSESARSIESANSHPTAFHSFTATPQEHGVLWRENRAGSKAMLRGTTESSTTMAMAQDGGHCDLSIDGSVVGAPIMGGRADGVIPRYVAGNHFFNYQLYGALRKGGSVNFLSREYVGYAVAAFISAYVNAIVMYLLVRVPEQDIRLKKTAPLKNMLTLQWTVVLLVGILSDAFAPLRLRRKPYMIAGWLASGVFWLALFLLFQYSPQPPTAVTSLLIVLAFFSLSIAANAMDIRIIELSQQEELQRRGRLLGTYQAVRVSAQVATHSLIAIIVRPDPKNLDVHLPFGFEFVFLHLAVLCWIPIYGLLRHAHEDQVPLPAAVVSYEGLSMGPADVLQPLAPSCWTRWKALTKNLWQSAQQKVVWQLILFNCLLFFFGFFELSDVKSSLQYWTREASVPRLVRNCLGDVSFLAAVLLWRVYGLNANWRRLTAGAIVFYVCVSFTMGSLVIYDVVRAPWIYTLGWVLRAPFRVLTLLAAFVPAIEIAPFGTEGTTYALLASFQTIVKFLVDELADAIVNNWPAIDYTSSKMKKSSSETENAQFYGLIVSTLWLASALTALFFLPQQKLDAQQLRVFGGYSRWPVLVLVLGFSTAIPYVTYRQILRL